MNTYDQKFTIEMQSQSLILGNKIGNIAPWGSLVLVVSNSLLHRMSLNFIKATTCPQESQVYFAS
jgi:hypothetical protein